MDAISDFEDSSLDFVYIDANHTYEAATEDIREWSKKVRPGGIVAGHDYVNTEGYGVIQAIHEHIQEKGIKTLFITSKDRSPSWFYIKPL
jgi:predicted O-methyltransferase YrrM